MPTSPVKRFFKSIETFFVRRKQLRITGYLLDRCGGRGLLDRYAGATATGPVGATSPLWVCWWQGEASMPPLVQACYARLRLQAGRHPVRLVTKDNYNQYVSFPPYVLERVADGRISLTHFSDLLRVALLSLHGGIWADATLLLPGPGVDDIIDPAATFWSCHHRPVYHNISRGGWVGFFWACGKGHPLPSFILELFLNYWKDHDKIVDYLFIDYAFALARAGIPAVHDAIEAIPLTVMGPLGKRLDEPYDPKTWKSYCRDYQFHKLNRKARLVTATRDGRPTNYAHILEQLTIDNGQLAIDKGQLRMDNETTNVKHGR